jgi:hypothetical protein
MCEIVMKVAIKKKKRVTLRAKILSQKRDRSIRLKSKYALLNPRL